MPRVVESKRLPEVERWLRLIDAQLGHPLEIAARRVVASMTERGDPRDALIDAVIAWDSLVGASGETVLRVTTALPVLLEENTRPRKDLRDELKRIYNMRSKIIHGGRPPSEADAHRAHIRALDVGLESLRRILAARPSLASYSAEERSVHLLLGMTDDEG
jgi:hypothetical protein